MQSIILLHGALGVARDLQGLETALKNRALSVHSFSLSGHGGQPFAANFSIQQFVGELQNFIQVNNLQGSAVFGYSMGGYVALCLALQQPGLISRIITLGTKFNWSAESVAKETAGLDPALMQQKVPAFANMLQNKHGAAHWQQLCNKTADLMRGINIQPNLTTSTLPNIQLPVLLGRAENDQMVSWEETENVLNALPNANFYSLPGKHQLESIDVEMLGEVIDNFVK